MAIIRLLSVLFLDEFVGNAKISVPMKSGSTVNRNCTAVTFASDDAVQ